MIKKYKLIILMLTQNNEKTIKRSIKSFYNQADKIIVIDSYSTDKTCAILKKKKIKIIKKKFINCPTSLNYGMKHIEKNYKNSIVLRVDSDETIHFKKDIKIIKSLMANILFNNNKNISILRVVTKNNLLISNNLKRFVARVSLAKARYNKRPMDEKLFGQSVNFNFLEINDFLAPNIKKHLIKHIKYAKLEFLSNTKKYSIKNSYQKIYYSMPIFIRSISYGIILLLTVRINKNFIYNLCYQFIRGIVYRIYVDFLIFKNFFK